MPTTRRPRGGCPTDIDAAVVARADALGLLVDLICHRIDRRRVDCADEDHELCQRITA